MTPREFLERCGWQQGVGGQFYFPADGYPHLHLGTTGIGLQAGNVGNNATQQNKRAAWNEMRRLILFVAVSNGTHGRNFIDGGAATFRVSDPQRHVIDIAGDDERTTDIVLELDYILRAYGYSAL